MNLRMKTYARRSTDTVAIKKFMVERGFKTIGSLADKSGIYRNTLGKVIDGKAQPSSDVMFRLVDTLGIPAAEAGEIFFAPNLRNT